MLELLKRFGLDLNKLVGIGTDGCQTMASEDVGAVSTILDSAPNAIRCPCYNHALNLTLSKTSSVSSIKNSIATVKEVCNFFNSAKRKFVLKKFANKNLISMCETRWVERCDSLNVFIDSLPNIYESLESISNWDDSKTASNARMLINTLTTTDFIMALHVQIEVFTLCAPLSRLLQDKQRDISQAANLINDLTSILQNKRQNFEEEFKKIFLKVEDVLGKWNKTVTMPRITHIQKHRENHQCATAEEYFRATMFVPMLDSVLADISSRFSNKTFSVCRLSILLPYHIRKEPVDSIAESINEIYGDYKDLLTQEHGFVTKDQLSAEIDLWRQKWVKSENKIPTDMKDVLHFCSEVIYPLVSDLLIIFFVMPISIASAERSFSTLKLIKNYLRNSMSQDRLNGLALLNIHRDININIDELIDRFAALHDRRIIL